HPVCITFGDGRGGDTLQIRAGSRFGHAERRNDLSARHFRQPSLPLLFSAVSENVVGDHGLNTDTDAKSATQFSALEFLRNDRVVSERATDATVFNGTTRAQTAGCTGHKPGFAVNDTLRLPLCPERQELLGKQFFQTVCEHVQLFGHPRTFVHRDFLTGSELFETMVLLACYL